MASTRPHPTKPGLWQLRAYYRGIQSDFVFGPEGNQSAKQVAEDARQRFDRRVLLVKRGDIAIPPDLTGGLILRFLTGDITVATPAPEKEGNGENLESLVKAYLKHRQGKVSRGELSAGSYDSDKRRLARFQAFAKAKGKSSVKAIATAEFLGAYREWVEKQIEKGKRGPVDAKHLLRTVKALVAWAYDEERIDAMPRNMRKYNNIKPPAPKPQAMTQEQVNAILGESKPLLRACVLLGLNCGFTQVDCATLEHSHIDYQTGLLTRERNKTGVPCEYKLWNCTIDAMREVGTEPGADTLVFKTRQGRPLVHAVVKPDGTYSKSDAVTQSFRRVARGLGISLTFKYLRKSGAQAIQNNFQDAPWLVDLYLAHAAPGMRKHYTNATFDKLHLATDWLEGYFDLSEGGTLSGNG